MSEGKSNVKHVTGRASDLKDSDMVEELELLSTVESEGKKEQNESEKTNVSTSFYL